MSSSSNNIQTKILFDHEAECVETLFSTTSLSAPTVFTGQRLRGTLFVFLHGTQEPLYDTIQILFKGIHSYLILNAQISVD
jgi:hypothetical protein